MSQLALKLHGNTRPKLSRVKDPVKVYEELQLVSQKHESCDPYKDCRHLIVTQQIDAGEAIDWLVARGKDEDEAFEWVMNRFYAGHPVVASAPTILDEVAIPKGRSRRGR